MPGRFIHIFVEWQISGKKDLVLLDGVYHVVEDGMHERTDGNIRENGVPEDPVNTLGYLKTFFTWIPRISETLGIDEEKRETWRDIADHLVPYPKGKVGQIQDNPTLWKEVDVKLEDLYPRKCWKRKFIMTKV